jgi:3-hydroxy-3-methylglutaryl CoA synthase
MDVSQYAEAITAENAAGQGATAVILDLDNIDDILADILTNDSLGEDLWDSET